MQTRTDIASLPRPLAEALHETEFVVRSYLAGLSFIVKDTARDPAYLTNHLLSSLAQDFLQSAISISSLATEGLHNVARRELRFLIEASVKIAFVQQSSYVSTIDEKLESFESQLSSQKITIKNQLDLAMLPADMRPGFLEEIGRLYGLTSDYPSEPWANS